MLWHLKMLKMLLSKKQKHLLQHLLRGKFHHNLLQHKIFDLTKL